MADACAPFDHAMLILGRRWAGGVVRAMLNGASRFGEIRAGVPGITDRMLSIRLKELTEAGLVDRRIVEASPVRADYHLTDAGRALAPVLSAIENWGVNWGGAMLPDQPRQP